LTKSRLHFYKLGSFFLARKLKGNDFGTSDCLENQTQGGSVRQPIRILFVGDDEEMLALYREYFEGPEFETRTAMNGNEAFRSIRNVLGEIDIMVTDNFMPGMEGLSLLKHIQEEYPDIRLIMITAHGNWQGTRGYNYGPVKFLEKPIKMIELKRLIRNEWINTCLCSKRSAC
jgi:DNA-binding NtrC family response regulator